MDVLPAVGGFSTAAGTRPRLRPVFARAAIGRLAQIVRSGSSAGTGGIQGSRVLLPEAGTGILAGQLARAGLQVLASDSNQHLAVQLTRSLPQVAVSCASLNALPVQSGTIDLICFAQESEQDSEGMMDSEVFRVLRPEASLALLVNQQDNSSPWAQDLTELTATITATLTATPITAGTQEQLAAEAFPKVSKYFSDPVCESFAHPVLSSVDQLVQQLRSSAAATQMLPTEQALLLEQARQLLSDHADSSGALELQQHTVLWLWRAV
ncbi:MAG: class I SAM-dependent methyltransferase [Microthrixaceae bacterium]